MEIKHTHPQYDDPQAWRQRMQEACAACMERLRALRAARPEKTV